MWLSIMFGILIGALAYLAVVFIIQLIKNKKAKKKDNKSIEE